MSPKIEIYSHYSENKFLLPLLQKNFLAPLLRKQNLIPITPKNKTTDKLKM